MIYIIKQEGLYQNKVNSSLVSNCNSVNVKWSIRHVCGRGGGWVLPIMAYTGRLCQRGVPFSGFRCMKG